MRSHAELLAASGYGQPAATTSTTLVRILDGEVRLITPTDPDGTEPRRPERRRAGPAATTN